MGRFLPRPARTGRAKATKKGEAGYDNPRENIDSHIRTKTISTLQLASGATVKGDFTVEGHLSGATISGASISAAGNDNEVQFNDHGKLSGSNALTWDGSELDVTGTGHFTGNVGIGLSDPDTKLEVFGAIKCEAPSVNPTFKSTGANTLMLMTFANDAETWQMGIRGDEGDDFVWRNGANTRLRVDRTGGNFHLQTKLIVGDSAQGIKPADTLEISGGNAVNTAHGYAITLTAGEQISGGYIVAAATNRDNVVVKTGIVDGQSGRDMPIGVAAADTASGASITIIVAGAADVYNDGQNEVIAGGFLTTSDTISGAVLWGAAPAVPATANHWREVGHPLESISGAGLFKAVLHFN